MVIVEEYTISWLIEFSNKAAVSLDTSWRNKNSNRAPVTFVTTTNPESGRMVPGAVMISSDIKETTLASMIQCLKKHVEYTCSKLLKRSTISEHLRVQAEKFSHEWTPLCFMIDMCNSLRGAIEKSFHKPVIRACQFHIAQAILRWQIPEEEVSQISQEKVPLLTKGFPSLPSFCEQIQKSSLSNRK